LPYFYPIANGTAFAMKRGKRVARGFSFHAALEQESRFPENSSDRVRNPE
jgi:hypothetical protein